MPFVQPELAETIDEALDIIIQESGSTREAFLSTYRTGVDYKIAENPDWIYRYLVHIRRYLPCQCDSGYYRVDIITTAPKDQLPLLVFQSMILVKGKWKWNKVLIQDASNLTISSHSLWCGLDYDLPSR